jgi:predicted transport protein
MSASWICPKCGRRFTRTHQRHACGTGDRAEALRNRPPELVDLYARFEKFVTSLGSVEFVTRERYVLLRTRRIFADLNIMTDALRIAIHLPEKMDHDLFIKVGADRRHVTHVAKLRTARDLEAMKPFLRKAYEFSVA